MCTRWGWGQDRSGSGTGAVVVPAVVFSVVGCLCELCIVLGEARAQSLGSCRVNLLRNTHTPDFVCIGSGGGWVGTRSGGRLKLNRSLAWSRIMLYVFLPGLPRAVRLQCCAVGGGAICPPSVSSPPWGHHPEQDDSVTEVVGHVYMWAWVWTRPGCSVSWRGVSCISLWLVFQVSFGCKLVRHGCARVSWCWSCYTLSQISYFPYVFIYAI